MPKTPPGAQDKVLRDHLLALLAGGDAHLTFEQALYGIPVKLRGMKPRGVPHSPWQILEHLRIAQWDIVDFSRNPKHVSPAFPEGYWPPSAFPPGPRAWNQSAALFRSDLAAMKALIRKPSTDLYARIPHGDGQTILREALVLADHNGYHLGEMVLVRRLLGAWKES